MSEQTASASKRPYFFWDYDLTEKQVRDIIRGDNEVEKAWVITRILEYARWEDIWRYLTVDDVRQNLAAAFPLAVGPRVVGVRAGSLGER